MLHVYFVYYSNRLDPLSIGREATAHVALKTA